MSRFDLFFILVDDCNEVRPRSRTVNSNKPVGVLL